jgi:hypothetical protein
MTTPPLCQNNTLLISTMRGFRQGSSPDGVLTLSFVTQSPANLEAFALSKNFNTGQQGIDDRHHRVGC